MSVVIHAQEIEDQLQKICASKDFGRSEKLRSFLSFVIQKQLAGQDNNIKAYTIAISVFGRPENYDAEADNIVRVYGGKLRRALKNYYENEGKDDLLIISIPKGGYIPVVTHRQAILANQQSGGPLADVTLEDVKRAPQNGLVEYLKPSLAVVMFNCQTGKEDYNCLASGLTLECILALSKFPALTVMGPIVSEENFFDPDKITTQFNDSTFILRGWINAEKDILQIKTSLCLGIRQKHIWGKSFTFNPEKDSLLKIEEEVSSTIAGRIGGELGIVFQQLQTESYPEYIKFNDVTRAVLRSNTYWFSQDPEDFRKAYMAIEKGIEKSPKNALLHALRGNLLYNDILHQSNWVEDSRLLMEEEIHYAIALDHNLQLARYNMVVLNSLLGKAEECLDEAQKVVAMNPNSTRILGGCSIALVTVGYYDEAKEHIERAKILNPQYPSWYHLTDYIIAYKDQQYELAWEFAKKIHVQGVLWHPIFRASILGMLGKKEEAAPYLEELLNLKADFLARPTEIIRRLFITDRHVKMIWDGLKKAGLEEFILRK